MFTPELKLNCNLHHLLAVGWLIMTERSFKINTIHMFFVSRFFHRRTQLNSL